MSRSAKKMYNLYSKTRYKDTWRNCWEVENIVSCKHFLFITFISKQVAHGDLNFFSFSLFFWHKPWQTATFTTNILQLAFKYAIFLNCEKSNNWILFYCTFEVLAYVVMVFHIYHHLFILYLLYVPTYTLLDYFEKPFKHGLNFKILCLILIYTIF